jgi:hypothetical protein
LERTALRSDIANDSCGNGDPPPGSRYTSTSAATHSLQFDAPLPVTQHGTGRLGSAIATPSPVSDARPTEDQRAEPRLTHYGSARQSPPTFAPPLGAANTRERHVIGQPPLSQRRLPRYGRIADRLGPRAPIRILTTGVALFLAAYLGFRPARRRHPRRAGSGRAYCGRSVRPPPPGNRRRPGRSAGDAGP